MNLKLIIGLVFMVTIAKAQPQILDKVIAIVGKNPLLLSEVETTILQQKEKKVVDENARCKIFEDLLFQKLLLSQADRDSIVVADAEVDNELTRRIQYYVGIVYTHINTYIHVYTHTHTHLYFSIHVSVYVVTYVLHLATSVYTYIHTHIPT